MLCATNLVKNAFRNWSVRINNRNFPLSCHEFLTNGNLPVNLPVNILVDLLVNLRVNYIADLLVDLPVNLLADLLDGKHMKLMLFEVTATKK